MLNNTYCSLKVFVFDRRNWRLCSAKQISQRPRGPMDKASAHGAGDCRFESCRGHSLQGWKLESIEGTKCKKCKKKQLLCCCHCSLALPPWACCCRLRLRLDVDGWPHRATNCCFAFIRSVASENKKHVFGKYFHSIDARNSSFASWRQIKKNRKI